jgi:hypothetical protein
MASHVSPGASHTLPLDEMGQRPVRLRCPSTQRTIWAAVYLGSRSRLRWPLYSASSWGSDHFAGKSAKTFAQRLVDVRPFFVWGVNDRPAIVLRPFSGAPMVGVGPAKNVLNVERLP